MNTRNIILAWKDDEYRLSLSDAERAMLPPHPAGLIDLADAELKSVAGGVVGTFASCQTYGYRTCGAVSFSICF